MKETCKYCNCKTWEECKHPLKDKMRKSLDNPYYYLTLCPFYIPEESVLTSGVKYITIQ